MTPSFVRRSRWPAALAAVAALAFSSVAPPVAGAQVVASRNMTLLAHRDDFPPALPGRGYSSCWSYVHEDGREYALIGHYDGTAIYDVSVPQSASLVSFIPGPPSTWREMKSYRSWIYIVTEGLGVGQGLQIVRMTDPDQPVLAASWTGSFVRSHSVSVDTARALLICNGTRNAAHAQTGMALLSLADPEAPVEQVRWPLHALSGVDSLYVHDSVIQGTRLYASCVYAGAIHVLDIADPAVPIEIAAWTYPGGFTHNAWPDTSGRWLYATDEARGEPLKVFDLADLGAPSLINRVTSNPRAIVHNAYVHGSELYLANYTEGVRVLDISDPAHPAEFAWADTWGGPSGGFAGVWNVCPYFPSGIVIASDRQTGLYVYRPVRDYGVLRVRVELGVAPTARASSPLASRARRAPGPTLTPDVAPAGAPAIPAAEVGGVDVRLVTQGDSLIAPASGVVRFAPSPGTHIVRARAFGYLDAEATVDVVAGARDSVLLTLAARPRVTLAGVVRDASNAAPLEEAEVILAGTPLHAHSEATGAFALPAVPEDSYALEIRRPGYAPLLGPFHAGPFDATTLDFRLAPAAWWDDLEDESGWTVGSAGDNAVAGLWTRVEPFGTGGPLPGVSGPTARAPHRDARERGAVPEHEGEEPLYPGEVQPEFDRTPGEGTRCFVTGQGDDRNDVWQDNVDGGRTTLTSPPLDLSGMGDPALGFWRWFYTDGDANDWLAVLVSGDDGASWSPVDTTRGLRAHWEERAIRVSDHVAPGGAVRVRFVAVDLGGASIVEAAVDDLIAYDLAVTPLAAGADAGASNPRLALSTPRPNPSRGEVGFAVTSRAAGRLEVEVVDVLGRRVRWLDARLVSAGTTALRWDGLDGRGTPVAPGVYLLRARLGPTEVVRRIARIR